jgi:peptide/nickel transport system permease protein
MIARNRRRSLYVCLTLVGLLAFIAAAAPLLAPYPPDELTNILTGGSQPPSFAHPFGTDPTSADVLSRVIYGARVSLLVASLSVLVMLIAGIAFGACAALAGGAIDQFMMRALDVLMAIPRLLILLAITALLAPLSVSEFVLVIGLTGWYDVARLVRGELHGLLGRDFVLAAEAAGVTRRRLFLRHLMPHLSPVVAVSATLGVAQTIALEAGLSYLGLGADGQSWGKIMYDGMGRVRSEWWLTLFPALATMLAVLACNALGDALRDVFTTEQVHG